MSSPPAAGAAMVLGQGWYFLDAQGPPGAGHGAAGGDLIFEDLLGIWLFLISVGDHFISQRAGGSEWRNEDWLREWIGRVASRGDMG